MNKAIIIGHICRDLDVRQNGDSKVSRFTVGVNRRFKNQNGQYDSDFIPVVCFGKTAEFAEKYFSKGMKVLVEGRIQTGSYTNKEGQKVYTTDLVAESLEFVDSKSSNAEPKPAQNTAPAQIDGFVDVVDNDMAELPFN